MKKPLKAIKSFFVGVYKELQKVSWPSRKTVYNHTLIVLVSSAIVMVVVSVIDYGLSTSFEYLLSLKQ